MLKFNQTISILLITVFAGSVQAQVPTYSAISCSKSFVDNGFKRFQSFNISSPPLRETTPSVIIDSKLVPRFNLPWYFKVSDLTLISEHPGKYDGFYHFPTYGETSNHSGMDRGQYLCGLQLLNEHFENPQGTSCDITVNNQLPAHYQISASCRQSKTGKHAELILTADPQNGRVAVTCDSPGEAAWSSFKDEFTGMSCNLIL